MPPSLNLPPEPSAGPGARRSGASGRAALAFAAVFAVLAAVEATCLFPAQSAPRAAAAWCWMALSGLVLASVAAHAVRSMLRGDFRSDPDLGWYLASLLAPMALVLFGVGGYAYTQINSEGVKEVASGLGLLSGRRDLGLFDTAFVGYPARQYLLAAAPSLLLGRGLVALRAGFGGIYLLSYASFMTCAWLYLAQRKAWRPMLLAGLAGALVALGSYALLYARLFEQTILPLSETLLMLAALLLYLRRPGPLPCVWMLWVLGLMCYSYAPALAAWALAMAALAYLAAAGPAGARMPLVLTMAYGLVACAVSVAAQVHAHAILSHLSLGDFPGGCPGAMAGRLFSGLHATFGIEESLIPAPLTLGILFVLAHSLKSRDARFPLLCLWAGATVVLSIVLKGYWQRVPEFDVQRAMVILPPLSLALAVYVGSNADAMINGRSDLALRAAVVAAIAFMLLNAAFLPLIRRVPRDYIPFEATDEEEATMLVIGNASPGAKVVYVEPPLGFPLEDNLAYFSPGTRVVHGNPPVGEHVRGNYVISFLGAVPYVPEYPYTRFEDHPVRYLFARPYLKIAPE